MKGTEFQFRIPEKLEETTPLFQSILELIVMTLKVPHLSSYLLYLDPPKCVFAVEEPNKMNAGLTEAMLLSGVAAT